ncbi:transcription and mRNA export factor ENY2-like [Bacillus rossius redtenbacheri]|uniref:transcription and mRNA export factor ENY2-like n=1 Tax=Bacillus rossius redtenbacheri TaxID=93214 RepID=UPI002FDC892B
MFEEAHKVLISSGEKERLKELLRIRLVECGWKDQMQMFCRDVVKEKGVNIKVEELIAEVTPKARAMVPDTVKKELLQKIKSYLSQDL